MPELVTAWLIVLVRWVHIFSSILWVGTTYYFTWLDGRFTALEKGSSDDTESAGYPPGPAVWMVHSGGFYRVGKTKGFDQGEPLHWFRWEAALTWMSGLLLLLLVYWLGGVMTDATVADITNGRAVAIGAGVLIVGWTVYDLMMQSPIGRSEVAAATLGYALIVATAFGLSRWLSGRAVYLHVGALFGTIMAANVWMRILPSQRRMVTALREGRTPDAALGARAKLRSKQNTYLAVPVVFLMMSNHFPTLTYGSSHGWVVLCGMVLLGWGAVKWIRRA
jgi:uncharacterized membrane protein